MLRIPTFCRKSLWTGMFCRNRPTLKLEIRQKFFGNLLASIYCTTLKITQDVGSTSFRDATFLCWTILSYNSEHSIALQIHITLHHYDVRVFPGYTGLSHNPYDVRVYSGHTGLSHNSYDVRVFSGPTGLSHNPCYDRCYLTSTTGCLPYLLISYKESVTERSPKLSRSSNVE